MDANDRNESAIRQREAKLARRVGEALDQLNPQNVGDCPDAEVIAAYAEQALGADELAQCEDHFATCGRCRNILKVLAAASDAPLAETEVAQLGQRVSAVRVPVEITASAAKRPRSKTATWSTRWLAPAVGVAAVLTVWFVMRPPWRAMDRSDSTTLIAQAPREEMPDSAPLAVDRAEKAAPAQEPPPAQTAAPNAIAEPPANESLRAKDSIRDSSPNDRLSKAMSAEKKEAAPLASDYKAKTSAAPMLAPAPPPVPPQAGVSSAMNSAAPTPRAQAQVDSAAAAAPFPVAPNPAAGGAARSTGQAAPVVGGALSTEATNKPNGPTRQPQATEVPSTARNFQALKQLRTGGPTPLLLKPASGASIWRAGIAGVIERSTDSGKTWSPQISPSKDDWLAGAAISDTVCWLAGRDGAIARTTDGKNWQGITLPSQAGASDGKLPDWTGITAQDAQSATITANDGTKFSTADGGKTWQPQ